MSIAADNVALALRLAGPNPGDWLARTDAVDQATYDALVHARRFTEACDFMLAHLARTEVTRTRVHGPGPTWDRAVTAFEHAVDRQQPAQIQTISALLEYAHQPKPVVGGVNVTRPPVYASGPAGAKDPTTRRAAGLPGDTGPCASDDSPTRSLVPVRGPDCGHVSDFYGMRCVSDAHPNNPDGHYYQAANGSSVPDRHTATEAQEG